MPKRSSKPDYSLGPEGIANTLMWFHRWLFWPLNVLVWIVTAGALLLGMPLTGRLGIAMVVVLLGMITPLFALPAISKLLRNGD